MAQIPLWLVAPEPGVNSAMNMRLHDNLSDILAKAADLPWDHHVYLHEGAPFAPSTRALVLNDDDEYERDDEGEPLYATSLGMKYCLTVQNLQDIVSNLNQQISNPDSKALVAALEYYVEHDAYVEYER